MNDLFLSVIAVSVGASAAGLVWALVQKRLEKRVCARWRCRVWTLLLTALLVLPLAGLLPESKAVANRPAFVLEVPEAAARPMGSGERTQEQAGPQTLPSGGTFVPAGEEPTQPGRTLPSPLTVAAAVWLLGAAGMLAVQMASYLRWRHGVRRWEQPAPDWVEPVVRAAAVEAGLSSLPRVRQSPLGASPMMAGLASPTLLLPVKLPPKEELALILAHEMAHCRRRDIQRKLLILLARAVHWFNPLVHWMAGQAQREIELACDETVAASRPPQWRQAYCQALLHAIDAAGQPAPVLSTRFALEKQEIMRRFARVMRPVKGKKGAAVFGLMALLALLCCCGLRVQLPGGESTSEPAASAASEPASSGGFEPASIPFPNPLPEQLEPSQEELDALTEEIEAQLSADWERPGRYVFARLDSVQVLPQEEWKNLRVPLTDGVDWLEGRSWMDCLIQPGGCILTAQTTTEYFPETILAGPQSSDGVHGNLYLALKENGRWVIADRWLCYQESELPEPSPDPVQEQLGLTRHQWLMLQHQIRALGLSGIFRDISDPLAELTADESAHYLYARAGDWGGLTKEGRTEASSSMIFQTDFTSQNSPWAGDWTSGPYLPQALQGTEEVFPQACPEYEAIADLLEEGRGTIDYAREGDLVTVTLTLPLESETVTMIYTFGLVPPNESGLFSRTFLQAASRV